ncbi:MAG: DUF4386 domain-containing protein, partial [Acidobacteria bacterium]
MAAGDERAPHVVLVERDLGCPHAFVKLFDHRVSVCHTPPQSLNTEPEADYHSSWAALGLLQDVVESGGASMTTSVSQRSPVFYARVAGTIYLAAMALSMFTQVYVPGQIIVSGDAAATARNLVASQGLFRAGIVVDILIFVSDVVIAWALYELLKPVDESLARLGAFLRVADAAVLAAVTHIGLLSVRLVSGIEYL